MTEPASRQSPSSDPSSDPSAGAPVFWASRRGWPEKETPPGGAAPGAKAGAGRRHWPGGALPRLRHIFGAEWPAFALIATLALLLGEGQRLLALGLPIPMAITLMRCFARPGTVSASEAAPPERDNLTGLPLRRGAEEAATQALQNRSGRRSACFAIEIDDPATAQKSFGTRAIEGALCEAARRLDAVLREGDSLCRIGPVRFAVILGPARRVDLESAIQIAVRLQTALAPSYRLDATGLSLTASIGFCLPERAPAPGGPALLEAAETALDCALLQGPAAIRAFTGEIARRRVQRAEEEKEIADALETGAIHAWFQPQICTETGQVSGFEALARWQHPERGLLPPSEFLPVIERLGLSRQLCDAMLQQSLRAIREWHLHGFPVETVAVNFTRADLQDPQLPQRIFWDLDRFDLAPGNLTIEILETVVAETADDLITRNIAELAEFGCGIDLDDFGTGHSSITHLRRFRVKRLKVDRSFVTRVDREPEQQQIVSAILSLAERLNIRTLAEGVETAGEHAVLAQLGCSHVQGFHIARPMPFGETLDFLQQHRDGIAPPPAISRSGR